jgi:thymidine kinase
MTARPNGCGQLQLILGPMFGGKTTELVRRLERYVMGGLTVHAFKPDIDTRYTDEEVIVSHNRRVKWDVTCVPVDNETVALRTFETLCDGDDVEVIGIDEAQFFNANMLYRCCAGWLKAGKIVILTALNGRYDQTPWPSVQALIPLATDITFESAVCAYCTTRDPSQKRAYDASYSHLKTDEPSATQHGVKVGDKQDYMAVCAPCFTMLSK